MCPCPRYVESPRKVQSLAVDEDFVSKWRLNTSPGPVPAWHGGSKAAVQSLLEFVRDRLADHPKARSHPENNGTSRISPYLHFGHLGPHTVAWAVQKSDAPARAKEIFLEQVIVRRELSINFVKFNPSYDSFECHEPWARRSLAEHARDPRSVTCTEEQLEYGTTHDPLWNAAQKQMVLSGWMHNYLRMYWAKKSRSGVPRWRSPFSERLNLMIAMNSMDAIRTAMRESRGPSSENTTGPGQTARCTGRSGLRHSPAPAGNLIRNVISRDRRAGKPSAAKREVEESKTGNR